jgi:hypothetical protein
MTLSFGTHVVMVGLVPTIHPSACSGICAALDPRDKPEDVRFSERLCAHPWLRGDLGARLRGHDVAFRCDPPNWRHSRGGGNLVHRATGVWAKLERASMSELQLGFAEHPKFNALRAAPKTQTGQPWDKPEDDRSGGRRQAMHATTRKLAGAFGEVRATTSPPPLWGRDRVGGIAEPLPSGLPPPLTPPRKGEGDPVAAVAGR